MKSRTVIALDLGTTHIKAILFNEWGEALLEEKCATPLISNKNGNVYCPEVIWKIVERQIAALCAVCKEPLGISITGMAEAGLIISRKSKKPLTDILPWFDTRTCALADRITPEESKVIFKSTGLRNSFKYGIYKFLWLLEKNNFDKQDVIWLSMCDYIAFRLTGEFVTDPTFAARTYIYNILKHRWDTQRIEAYGLCTSNFPRVVPSGECFGNYKGIPVVIAGHDHICAAFGLLYHNRQGICDSAGTSETYVGILEDRDGFLSGFPEDSGLLYGPFADTGYFYMANIPSSGHSVEWFRKKLQMEELSYAKMNSQLSRLSKEPTGILYFPYLTGMGAPWYKADMQGAILGMTEKHVGIQILKGIIEGIQYQAKWLLSLLEQQHGITAKMLTCAGGAVHNETLMQIKADILGLKVSVPAVTEATLSGAAALFLYKNKGHDAAEQFLKKPLTTWKEYSPDGANNDLYTKIFKESYLPYAAILTNQSVKRT